MITVFIRLSVLVSKFKPNKNDLSQNLQYQATALHKRSKLRFYKGKVEVVCHFPSTT